MRARASSIDDGVRVDAGDGAGGERARERYESGARAAAQFEDRAAGCEALRQLRHGGQQHGGQEQLVRGLAE